MNGFPTYGSSVVSVCVWVSGDVVGGVSIVSGISTVTISSSSGRLMFV
mgnify:CR=1 FL=1